ncbi:DUF1330 domain-containing protein [Rhodobacterales bacterium]|nr:DUF1330 domain-containing protein [Rhodobacterales bacterium]
MTVQVLAFTTVTDKDAPGAYREKASDALSKHCGSLVGADPEPMVLEASGDTLSVVALLAFPSADAAKAWREDPELADVHALRNKGGKSTIVMLPA